MSNTTTFDEPAGASSLGTTLLERADLHHEIAHLEDTLVTEFASTVPEKVVLACVRNAVDSLGDTRVHHFVPIFVERLARRELAWWIAAKKAATEK